ncbi:hypothetical protein QLX08_004484 [Tetragonisca angustula]|uniref:Uncharacterized protein n=1 Tax=Tetragonisca angustula TaxID=166442 RepID=A0AAW1A224_9HYME
MLPNSPADSGFVAARGWTTIEDDRCPATHEVSRGAGSSAETFCQRGALSSRLSTPMGTPSDAAAVYTPFPCVTTQQVHIHQGISPGHRLPLYFPAHKFISWETAGQLAWGPGQEMKVTGFFGQKEQHRGIVSQSFLSAC